MNGKSNEGGNGRPETPDLQEVTITYKFTKPDNPDVCQQTTYYIKDTPAVVATVQAIAINPGLMLMMAGFNKLEKAKVIREIPEAESLIAALEGS